MAVRNSVTAILLSSIDTATFTGNYQLVNTTGLPSACFLIRIINDSDRDATISYDGTIDHDFSIAQSASQLESQTNSQPNNFTCLFPKGQKVYVKGIAGGTGLIYLAGYYQVNAN